MSFLSAREHGAKPGSGGVASAQQEVRCCITDSYTSSSGMYSYCAPGYNNSIVGPFVMPASPAVSYAACSALLILFPRHLALQQASLHHLAWQLPDETRHSQSAAAAAQHAPR
jgi:hypothetical protein